MTENELLEQLEHQVTIGTGQVTPLRLAAAAHIRAQSAEIAWLRDGLAKIARGLFDGLEVTHHDAKVCRLIARTALKELGA